MPWQTTTYLLAMPKLVLNDYSISEKYSKKLESAVKLVASFANRLSEQAAVIMDKVDKTCDV